MRALFALLGRLNRAMLAIGAVCLAAMAVLTGADVLSRGVANRPIFGTEELVSFLAVLVVAFALPAAHSERSHIGVELFMRFFPRQVRRIMRLITDLAALGLYGVVTWRMVDYGLAQRASGEVSMNLELPEYWIVFILAFGFLVFTLTILKDLLALAYATEE